MPGSIVDDREDMTSQEEHTTSVRRLRRRVWAVAESVWALKQVFAERLRLNVTDLRCLELILEAERVDGAGTVTPGRLAQEARLTTGAITGALDRLEGSGLIQREHDLDDRRRIILRSQTSNVGIAAKPLFDLLDAEFASLHLRYGAADLELTLRIIEDMNTLLYELTRQLRSGPPSEMNGL